MCGIFGVTLGTGSTVSARQLRAAVDLLFTLSESRGKEASGLAIATSERITVDRAAVPATTLIRTPRYAELFTEAVGGRGRQPIRAASVIGHSRLVTNGSSARNGNNQPVTYGAVVGVHNGIIVNDAELWRAAPHLTRRHEVDTEILMALVADARRHGASVVEATRTAFRAIEGTASVAMFVEDAACVILATNNGSLYTAAPAAGGLHVFASEDAILRRFSAWREGRALIDAADIRPLPAGHGTVVDLMTGKAHPFSLACASGVAAPAVHGLTRPIVDRTASESESAAVPEFEPPQAIVAAMHDGVGRAHRAAEQLRRCTRCILPETMPFVDFDADGVCSYCRHHLPIGTAGSEALEAACAPYRRTGRHDCLVPLSGGRDSSYGLHYARTVLKMNPAAYTYDWGMVTDLARRNIARMCGKLGVEHILISADIRKKRENIRRNVLAWLRQPDLGMVPLLMAGDKQYFYYANRLRRQLGLDLTIYSDNRFETTYFKTGFAGIPPRFTTGRTYSLGLGAKLRLAGYYAQRYLQNPAYLNRSVSDTLSAYLCFYFLPHGYLDLFRYVTWDESAIVSTLVDEYKWELALDSTNSWRIGDGTAAFYNYIYYCFVGFTENDTFRSNQIRETLITRDQALALVARENDARIDTFHWYCTAIGIDAGEALRVIHAAAARFAANRAALS